MDVGEGRGGWGQVGQKGCPATGHVPGFGPPLSLGKAPLAFSRADCQSRNCK